MSFWNSKPGYKAIAAKALDSGMDYRDNTFEAWVYNLCIAGSTEGI